jgi:hypothetical protein
LVVERPDAVAVPGKVFARQADAKPSVITIDALPSETLALLKIVAVPRFVAVDDLAPIAMLAMPAPTALITVWAVAVDVTVCSLRQ